MLFVGAKLSAVSAEPAATMMPASLSMMESVAVAGLPTRPPPVALESVKLTVSIPSILCSPRSASSFDRA